MTRLTQEHHDTLAATIGRREWTKTRTDLERATLVLEHMTGFAVEHVTPAQVAVAMQAMPLNAQDICNYADMACALAAVLPRTQPQSINAELLAVAQKCEAMLTRQKWLPEGTDPEAVLLREARAAIAIATQVGGT